MHRRDSASSQRAARRPAWKAAIVLATIAGAAVATSRLAGQGAPGPMLPDSVTEGWKVFNRKECLRCHAVWGLGGQIGPDLGRTEQQDLSAGKLAGTLWNHIPKVQSYVLRNHLEFPRLSPAEVSDLFSFLFFARYLDEPGDPAAGQAVLREKDCALCHLTEGSPLAGAPDLKRWAGYANPVVWAQKMWESAPAMDKAMKEAGITWPQLDDTDLMNIMAYLRSIGGHEAKIYLEPGSAERGARLFADRTCRACHHPGGSGPDLATVAPPRSLAALASRMWNHSPEMTRMMQSQGLERSPLTAQEMADIIAYIVSLRYDQRGGDPTRGRAVFERKQCAQCHDEEASGELAAPAPVDLAAMADPVRLAPAMWNHGVAMMERISDLGEVWPVFEPDEIVDLIAYLESIAPAEAPAATAAPAPVVLPATATRIAGPPIEAGVTCVSNVCHPGVIAEREVHAPSAQGMCSACHALIDPATHRFELTAGDSDLCYQCHEERGGSLHGRGPVAVRLCTACHDPHSADNLYGPGFTGDEVCFAHVTDMTVALETLVGGETSTWSESPAAPAAPPGAGYAGPGEDNAATLQTPADVTAMPWTTPGGVAATPAGGAPSIPVDAGCVSAECHATTVSGRFVHGPTAQQQCEACHALVDERSHRFELTEAPPDLCYVCHDPIQESEFMHGPVALGTCTVCHDPHNAPNQYMLPEPDGELCYMCHSEMGAHVSSARVPHAAIGEQGCSACHDPHGASFRYQLKADMPDLCLECHEPVAETIATAVVAHDPVFSDKQCVNCHNPHGSDVPMILTASEMDLCLDCHDRPMDTPHGPIIDMQSWIANNPERHGPIRDSSCTGCHQPHGSENFRILKHEFPREFYRPFALETYDLCFQCHEETLVLDERTTTLTGFRNGDKNLHYLHVNQEKGRTCRACHEIHAGTKPKRIKDFVPFGNWQYPVNFEMTEHGGRCAPGCHLPRGYDRRQEILQD